MVFFRKYSLTPASAESPDPGMLQASVPLTQDSRLVPAFCNILSEINTVAVPREKSPARFFRRDSAALGHDPNICGFPRLPAGYAGGLSMPSRKE